jgi:hypothetical protein
VARFHLAKANIGRVRAPLEDPIMEGFRTQLDPINALADRSPGFVWRLQTEDGNAMAIRPFADERIAINMSVWESLDALQQFVYRSAHVQPLRDRKEWFESIEGPILVLWWIPAGHIPTVVEAQERLQVLKDRGPSPEAFTFRASFPPPDGKSGDAAASTPCSAIGPADFTPSPSAALGLPRVALRWRHANAMPTQPLAFSHWNSRARRSFRFVRKKTSWREFI